MRLLTFCTIFVAALGVARADDVIGVSAVDLFTHTEDYVGKRVRVTGMWDAESSEFHPATPAIKYTCSIFADVTTNKAASKELRGAVERIWLRHVGGRDITLVCDFEGAFVRNSEQKIKGIFEYKLIISRVHSFREPTPPGGREGRP